MRLLEPTQKFINAFPDGDIAKYYKFWFNIDLLFIATTDMNETEKRNKFKEYANGYEINLTYEDFIQNFNVSFAVFIEEFKDVPELFNRFNFKG